jgi:hypothetical protein
VFNKHQLKKKTKTIETFKELNGMLQDDNTPYTNEDFDQYSKIIKVFKDTIDRMPSKEELFASQDKLNTEEIDFDGLKHLLINNKSTSKVTIFPEVIHEKPEKGDTMENINSDKKNDTDVVKNDDGLDGVLVINEEPEEPVVFDEDNEGARYVINRPTIYNFNFVNKKPFHSLDTSEHEKKGGKTSEKIGTSKTTVPSFSEDESKPNPNRIIEKANKLLQSSACFVNDSNESNKLAINNEHRNINELKYGCERADKSVSDEKYKQMESRQKELTKFPLRNAPICALDSENECDVQPVEFQTSILGTFIDEAHAHTKMGSMVPPFKKREEDADNESNESNDPK